MLRNNKVWMFEVIQYPWVPTPKDKSALGPTTRGLSTGMIISMADAYAYVPLQEVSQFVSW